MFKDRTLLTSKLGGVMSSQLTHLPDWVQRADGLQRAELQPVGDFDWLQKELAPPVVGVLTNHPTEEEDETAEGGFRLRSFDGKQS